MYVRSQRAEDLARKLAERTGKSIAQVVEDALDEQWQRVEAEPVAGQKRVSAAELMDIGRRAAVAMSPDLRAADFDALLYDDKGLPK